MGEGAYSHVAGAENGIGDVRAPIDALLGVFLGPYQPNLTAAPGGRLDFSTLASRDFITLAPLLKQPFFIGDGRRNDGVTVQTFQVPTGATRLFLGTMDGYEWSNNVGSLSVQVDVVSLRAQADVVSVPEPNSLLLLAAGLVGGGLVRRRRR